MKMCPHFSIIIYIYIYISFISVLKMVMFHSYVGCPEGIF